MEINYVQFSDETQTRIIASFGSPQSLDDYPNMGEVYDEDPRYADFLKRLAGHLDEPVDNAAERDRLLGLSAMRIAPLQYAKDLDMINAAEQKSLLAWMKYSVEVNRADLSADPVVWPKQPK